MTELRAPVPPAPAAQPSRHPRLRRSPRAGHTEEHAQGHRPPCSLQGTHSWRKRRRSTPTWAIGWGLLQLRHMKVSQTPSLHKNFKPRPKEETNHVTGCKTPMSTCSVGRVWSCPSSKRSLLPTFAPRRCSLTRSQIFSALCQVCNLNLQDGQRIRQNAQQKPGLR